MTGQADENNRLAEQLSQAKAQANESDVKLKELQAFVQSLATRASVGVPPGSPTSAEPELPTPAPHVASHVRPQQRQETQRKKARGRGPLSCACGSRPATAAPVLPPQASLSQTAVSTVKPGAEWTAAIFDKYAEDPSVSQRILMPVDGAQQSSTERRRLASAALADLVEIVYLPRLARVSRSPESQAPESLVSLLPRSSWSEDGPEWAALTARFGISKGFASGFNREQYFAWDMEVARECSLGAATAATPLSSEHNPKSRWERRSSKTTAAAAAMMTSPLPQQLQEHYRALEAGGEHQLTPTSSCVGSNESLSLPLMPTVSVGIPATFLQDEATQEAVEVLERAAGRFRQR